MGTDIHSRLEIFRPEGWYSDDEAAGWKCVTEALFDYPYFNADRPVSINNFKATATPLRARNYRLFAMLADVRNGRGFAGVDTGDEVEPIAAPKGVPADASAEWLSDVERWDVDMHSHSYLTLAELDAYNWDGVVFERGFVPEAEYLRLRGTEESPQEYSGGIYGGNIVTFTAAEYEALKPTELLEVKGRGTAEHPTEIYVQHQWAETRRQNMGELTEVMEIMRNSAPREYISGANGGRGSFSEPDFNGIRIVFGFDN